MIPGLASDGIKRVSSPYAATTVIVRHGRKALVWRIKFVSYVADPLESLRAALESIPQAASESAPPVTPKSEAQVGPPVPQRLADTGLAEAIVE
jgi:hypothetical protein